MPKLVPHDHKYWCPGGWPWEWFDTCTRHGHAWQYDFDWVHTTGFAFFSDHQGCEAGTLYSWREFGGGIGSSTSFHVTEFFDDRLSPEGECALTGAGGYPLRSSEGLLGRPPGLAMFGDGLYAVWKGMLGDQSVWWSSFGQRWFGQGWASQQRIDAVGSSIGPSIAAFNEQLYAVWKGVTGDESIWWSSFDGQSWAPQQRIAGGAGTSIAPSVAVFNGRLYAAWKGVTGDERIWWSSFDGQSWAPQEHIVDGVGTTVGTSIGPSIAVFNSRLYAAWKGVTGDERIWWSSFDGRSWAPQLQIVDGVGTSIGSSVGPSIAVFNGRLYAVWKGIFGDQHIWWSSFDGQSWAPQLQISGVATSPEPV
jgi:hypothetical protein